MPRDLIVTTPDGLFCPPGNFHIDPWRPVAQAIITHAHGDHLRAGNANYIVSAAGAGVARLRLPADASVTTVPYRTPIHVGGVTVSLHPAGHILGSSQVRIEHDGAVWVVSGDYKRDPDPTCEAFEPQSCDVFISEATFALPAYRWPSPSWVAEEIFEWWNANRRRGVASVLFAYALGKAQRLLAELSNFTDEAVYIHGAVAPLTDVYRAQGIKMLPTLPAHGRAQGQLCGCADPCTSQCRRVALDAPLRQLSDGLLLRLDAGPW